MKSLQICFAGLAVLFLAGGCGPRTGPIPASNLQKTTATVAAPMVAAPTNPPRPTVTPFPAPTQRATSVKPTTSITEPLITSIPSITPISSITPLPTATMFSIQTKPTSGPPKPLQCHLISTSPELGQIIKPMKDFQGIWRLYNVGTLPWHDDDIALFFVSGHKFQSSKYEEDFIPYVANPGDQLNLHVPMKAPKEPGLYSAIWGLRSKTTRQFFCIFSIFVQVQ